MLASRLKETINLCGQRNESPNRIAVQSGDKSTLRHAGGFIGYGENPHVWTSRGSVCYSALCHDMGSACYATI